MVMRSIHDQSQTRRRHTADHERRAPDAGSPATSRRRRAAKKSPKAEEHDKHSNYYPITWRVIGGGVMMGGERE